MHAFHVGADFRSRSTWQRRTRKTAAIVEIAKMAMNKKKNSFAKDETSRTQSVRPQLETSMTKHFVSDNRSDTIPTIHNTRSALAAQRSGLQHVHAGSCDRRPSFTGMQRQGRMSQTWLHSSMDEVTNEGV